MTKRPHYVPPIRSGEGTHSSSPRAVLAELLGAPPTACGAAIFLLLHGHLFAAMVSMIFFIIAVVQAAVYAPRAHAAATSTGGSVRDEHEGDSPTPSVADAAS